jgi:hypothetical protein
MTVATRKRGMSWADVCAFARSLPEVEEGTSYGTPALRVRRTFLARLREDGETLVVPVDLEERPFLIDTHPRALFVTEHYERWPLVLVALPQADPALVRELIEDAWSERAPKRAVQAWLAEHGEATG